MNVTTPGPGQDAAGHLGTKLTLLEWARRTAQTGAGKVAVAVGYNGAPWPAHRRRVLKVLLQDAAQTGGGQVFETVRGDCLLLGTAAGPARRVTDLLARLAGAEPLALSVWELPRDNPALLGWVEGASLPAQQPVGLASMVSTPVGLQGFDAAVAALVPERLARRQAVIVAEAGRPRLYGRMLHLSGAVLAAELGAFAADPDLLRHAADAVAARLPDFIAATASLDLEGMLLFPLPHGPLPPAPRPGLVGILPASEASDPGELAERRAALDREGYNLAIGGLDAAALALMEPAVLPADLLLLQWSPAFATAPGPSRHASQRAILTGCDGAGALAWGASHGITRFAGPHVETLLAAARLAACPAAAGCSPRQCEERAAATAEAGRTGCRNLPLLDAMLPGGMGAP